MPSALDAPVLQVDANVIHKVDTSNPQNLFNMWTVFARCADSVAQGRRLENLSWRLWTRETFCVDAAHTGSLAPAHEPLADSTTLAPKPTDIPQRSHLTADDLPQLSGSVESVADEEAEDLPGESGAVEIVRPRILRQDSCGSSRSRGRERHITSDDLEKMVASIVQGKESLQPLPRTTSLPLAAPAVLPSEAAAVLPEHTSDSALFEHSATILEAEEQTEPTDANENENEDADTDADVDESAAPAAPVKTTTVIRGFSPSHLPIHMPEVFVPPASQEAQTIEEEEEEDDFPEPTSAPAAKLVPSKKATFALGGSSSCEDSLSDPSQSLDMHSSSLAMMMKKKAVASMSNLAGAAKAHAEEDSSLKSAMLSTRNLGAQKKQTSFSNQVMTRTIPAAPVFEDDSESDDIDESAIDEDDSDWEDSNEDSGRSSVDDKNMFQRVDSKVHLPSRRSLITLMIQKSEGEVRNGLTTSQSAMTLSRPRVARQPPSLVASPTDSDDAALTMRQRNRPQSNLRPINEIPRSAAQPIMSTATGGHYQAAYSPRTNRRNMLSTELTESLRRHLLWERSQKTSTANAVLKRRHTSQDVANLKQYPEVAHMNKDNDANASSWDQYLNRDAFNGYHAKGW